MPDPQKQQLREAEALPQVPLDVRHLLRRKTRPGAQAQGGHALLPAVSEFSAATGVALFTSAMLLALAVLLHLSGQLPESRLLLLAFAAGGQLLLWFAARRLVISRSLLWQWWLALTLLCATQLSPWWELLLASSELDPSWLAACAGVALSLLPLLLLLPVYILLTLGLLATPLIFGELPQNWLLPVSMVLQLLIMGAIVGVFARRKRTAELREQRALQALAGLKSELADQVERVNYEQDQRHSMQRDLVAVRELADSAGHAKTEFLATISHEIRTPLNGILPILEILQETRLDEEQQRYVRTAFSSSRHLLRIINDILDFAKAESGKLQLESIEVDLREQVNSVIELMGSSAENKGLQLQVEFDEQVPSSLRGDPIRLRQVLINLLSNAIKFTDNGEIRLSVERRRASRREVELMFSVSDTGIGMSRETSRKLFQSFTQADASTTRKHGGTGLGLAICKRLVELMGGRIGVRSRLGEGSTFWFVLPMRKSVLEVPTARKNLNGVRLLTCIPDADTAQGMSRQLREWGVVAESSPIGEVYSKLHASAMLGQSWLFELLLVDTWGVEQQIDNLLRQVRGDPLLRSLNVVLAGRSEALLERLNKEYAVFTLSGVLRSAPLRRVLYRLFDVETGAGYGDASHETNDYRDLNLEREFALHDTDLQPVIGSSSSSGARGRILLVEDNPVNLGVVRRVLERLGVQTLVAHNGREALEQLQAQPLDLVFMDCQMPVMDGYEATRQWRKQETQQGRPALPVIAMTANAMQGDREKCLQAGMDDYLAKPVSIADLQAMLQQWMPSGFASTGSLPEKASRPEPDAQVVLDDEVIAELREVMEEEFEQLIGTYLDNTPQLLEQLQRAAAARDLPGMVIPAHSIKSSSANLGAMQLSGLAREIEMAAREQRLDAALATYRRLDASYAATREALRAQLQAG